MMETVTISPKFQVVIPREIRRRLALKPGTKVQMISYGNRIELIPVQPMKDLMGFLRGMDTTVKRDKDRL